MKIEELHTTTIEESNTGTSVVSVGDIEYTTAGNGKINLKKRFKHGDEEVVETVATIKRENKQWKFEQTKNWSKNNLPHMGHRNGTILNKKGLKTNEISIESTLSELGIRYDSLTKEERKCKKDK